MKFDTVTLRQLTLDDERSFRHVGLYRDLKQIALDDALPFRVPAGGASVAWSRTLLLNLTYWSAAEPADVLTEARMPADALAHATWHHLARVALAQGPMSADALFLGESIASAFDLYLVGRLLGNAPDSDFITTQVPAMADCALDVGLDEDTFEALITSVAADPDAAFEDLRALLFDACVALAGSPSIDEAAARLDALSPRRFSSLLHHYELSNWVLYARAYASAAPDARAREIDAALRAAPCAIDWLETHWVAERLARGDATGRRRID